MNVYGHNFYNSIIKSVEEGRGLKITTEQTGTPTNAIDLSEAILKIISFNSNNFGGEPYSISHFKVNILSNTFSTCI